MGIHSNPGKGSRVGPNVLSDLSYPYTSVLEEIMDEARELVIWINEGAVV